MNYVLVFPQTEQVPLCIGRPFFAVNECKLIVSVCFLHLTQYIFLDNHKIFIFILKMEVKDLSCNENVLKIFNNPLFPNSIRGLIVGKSACGKQLCC